MQKTVKCPCGCGHDVDIPADILEAAEKWMARSQAQKDLMQKKRAEDPNYGQVKILNVPNGDVILPGALTVGADNIRIQQKKNGEWDGWVNLDYRGLMADPRSAQVLKKLDPGTYHVELGTGERRKIKPTRFIEGARRPRLEFIGVGELNLLDVPGK